MKIILKTMLLFSLLMTVCVSSSESAESQMFNMSYLFFGSPSSYIGQVDMTKDSLNVVSPSYFDITAEGNLLVTWRLQSSFITEMHNRGLRVVPFLSNHWNSTSGVNGLTNREKLATDVANAIETYNLDGVDVDIEGLGSTYKDIHTDFIRLLREKIPKNKEVSVAVAANPNGWTTGWHGFYDYKKLSDYADYLMIMAYDESWESPDSPIGPVASINFSEKSIQYALSKGVPKEKIVYGIPFYGRMWKTDGVTLEGRSITGMGVSSTKVDSLIKTFNGVVKFDEEKQSSYTTFTIPKGEYATAGNAKLTEGDYLIWFENEKSLRPKLRLPTKYSIKGTGSWALYHELPEMWDYYSLWLNGRYFSDVPSGYWAENSINKVSQKGWMKGTTDTTFSPSKTLTRAQGAVILVRALGNVNMEPKQYVFKDLSGHWGQKEIEVARELGYLSGVKRDQFSPNAPLTRAQLATILYNIFEYPITPTQSAPFSDVNSSYWSYDAILAIHQKGYIGGYQDGTFRPTQYSTRAQMSALMERMATDFENKQ